VGRPRRETIAARAHNADFVVRGMNGCLHIALNLNSNPLILQERPEIQQPSKSLIVRLLSEAVRLAVRWWRLDGWLAAESQNRNDERRVSPLSTLISWNTVATLWAAWVLYWFLSAWRVRRTERGESTGQRFLTAAVLGVGGFLIFARSSGFGPLDRRFLPNDPIVKAGAMVLIVTGLGISVWARRHIGQFWSARVMPEGESSTDPVRALRAGSSSDL
jgi:hypothetical protein